MPDQLEIACHQQRHSITDRHPSLSLPGCSRATDGCDARRCGQHDACAESSLHRISGSQLGGGCRSFCHIDKTSRPRPVRRVLFTRNLNQPGINSVAKKTQPLRLTVDIFQKNLYAFWYSLTRSVVLPSLVLFVTFIIQRGAPPSDSTSRFRRRPLLQEYQNKWSKQPEHI